MAIASLIDAARLRMTLNDLDPSPWRDVIVPLSMTFKGLHETIQAAFLWSDCHLCEFEVEGHRYGLPFEDGFEAEKVFDANVARLTKLRDRQISEFSYVYDMGDNWEHHVEVLELLEAQVGSQLPVFVDGKWRTPPEDVGGPPGFERFVEIINNRAHEEHDHLMDWHGGPFDPDDIEADIVKILMGRLSAMRRIKK